MSKKSSTTRSTRGFSGSRGYRIETRNTLMKARIQEIVEKLTDNLKPFILEMIDQKLNPMIAALNAERVKPSGENCPTTPSVKPETETGSVLDAPVNGDEGGGLYEDFCSNCGSEHCDGTACDEVRL